MLRSLIAGAGRPALGLRQGARCLSGASAEEIKMLEKLLKEAKGREDAAASATSAGAEVGGDEDAPKFNIGTFNAISPSGLAQFPTHKYATLSMTSDASQDEDIHSILLRSHKLKSAEVPDTVRAIARCGSGTNNIDVAAMTERGIVVQNTPGANANAVKELSICALLLASRGIAEGIAHVPTIVEDGAGDWAKIKKQVETDKKKFVGMELSGKTLAVVGLGHIGASVAQAAIALGMNVKAYDPSLSLDAAWRLPGDVLSRASSIEELVEDADYISLHVPYMKETHHLLSGHVLKLMKPNAHIVNFARGELVDTAAMKGLYDTGSRTGKYVSDFVDENLYGNPKVIAMPHLGASTAEAEDNAASMAAQGIMSFIETGTIVNSVNFPTTKLDKVSSSGRRICIVNKNVPGMLGLITTTLGRANVNIVQQINTSRGEIAYNVIDISNEASDDDLDALQAEMAKLDGVISSRVISAQGRPGFFVVNSQ